MKIQRSIVGLVLAVAMAAAGAQSYKWVDKDGKVRYSDIPPPGGVKFSAVKPPASTGTPAASPASDGAKDAAKAAPKGPLTPVEQEQAYRKRKLEEEEARKKQEDALAADQTRKQNCDRAQENVRVLESGQRITRTDAKGERYFVDDDQRAKDIEVARKSAADWCSK